MEYRTSKLVLILLLSYRSSYAVRLSRYTLQCLVNSPMSSVVHVQISRSASQEGHITKSKRILIDWLNVDSRGIKTISLTVTIALQNEILRLYLTYCPTEPL